MHTNLRIGVVGTGYIANVMAGAATLTGKVSFVAVASRRSANAEAFARKHNIPFVFDTWSELVASDELDAVYVATPTGARAKICLAAAEHQKHILAEKPFVNLESLQKITTACQANGVTFMDATHFPYHPRTQQLKHEIETRIGKLITIHSCFYFPSPRENNIRYDVQQEPTGAIGDMTWYSMRAVAEFTPDDATVLAASGFAQRDRETGALIQGSGVLQLSDGCAVTWDVGYNTGTCIMDLRLIGERGLISLDDFVLDWKDGFPIKDPAHEVSFIQRVGLVTPPNFEHVPTPSPYPPTVNMLQQFRALTDNPFGADAQASMRISERTQSLLDAITDNLEIRMV